jgi:hypothetical protein
VEAGEDVILEGMAARLEAVQVEGSL